MGQNDTTQRDINENHFLIEDSSISNSTRVVEEVLGEGKEKK